MLIVGGLSSEEERNEALFVAQVALIVDRIRYLARKNRK
jgi:hypothetical protein